MNRLSIVIGLGICLILSSCNINTENKGVIKSQAYPKGKELFDGFDVSNTFSYSGSALHLSYYYHGQSKQEYMYQLKLYAKQPSFIVKYKLDSNFTSTLPIDTFVVKPLINCDSSFVSAMFYTIGLDSFVLTTSFSNGNDTLYTLVKDQRIKQMPFQTHLNRHLISPTYHRSKNQIVSSIYMGTCFPVYYHNAPVPRVYKWPNFSVKSKDKMNYGLWPIGVDSSKIHPLNYDMLRLGFSIHLKDRIYHLERGGNQVEVYFPLNDSIEIIPLPTPLFKYKIEDHLTKNLVQLYGASDYWIQFVYNKYKNVFYLVQHVGLPNTKTDGLLKRELKPTDTTSVLYVLDSSFNVLKTYNIQRSQQFSTVLPLFITTEGVITQHIT